MIRTSKRTSALGIVSVAAMCLGLSACLPPKAMWSDNDTVKRNVVALHHITHDLKFAGDATGLTDAQVAELDRFLANSMVGYGDEFSIETPSNDVSADRRVALSSYLKGRGLVVSSVPVAYGGPLPADSVRLILNRYAVTPPPCPDWRKPATTDFNNQTSSNFGCATETNLGLMVANPRDLANGRNLGPADAENAAKSVENYREDKVPEPKSLSTSSSGGSSGGSK